MGQNTFGNILKFTSFGESHGVALGCIIDGCPAGVEFDVGLIQKNLDKRKPGNQSYALSGVVSDRAEKDQIEILSGVYEGKTLGTPIAAIVRNQDTRSKDYEEVKSNPRSGHADDMWRGKFLHSDHRGGGRSSGRETLARVIAGSVAQMIVRHLSPATTVTGFTEQVGDFSIGNEEREEVRKLLRDPDSYKLRFPSDQHLELSDFISNEKASGHSHGGHAGFFINNPPPYLGQPVFHKFKSDLASAVLSIGASNSIEIGESEISSGIEGSQFHTNSEIDSTYRYGGIRGGITTGEDIYFRVNFKPTSSVLDVAKKGRHDPCIIPRAIPVVEAMCWLILADHMLWSRCDRI